jgi:ABC-type branched-subunit amino acid transport system substrate-binding protein
MRCVSRPVSTFAAMVAMLVAAGCGAASGSNVTARSEVRLYGTDAIMSNSFGDALKDSPGLLAGMKGTAPLAPLTEDFKQRIRAIDPSVPDYNYAGEGYDAVMMAALAAEVARTTDPTTVAKYIVGVTVDGTVCESFKACVAQIRANANIQYRGVSSLKRSGLTDVGEPSTATYGTLNFGRDNHIDDAKTEFVGAGDESGAAKNAPSTPGVPPSSSRPAKVPALKFGALLPHTGSLGFLGPPIFAGGRLAVQEINEAGGVLGQPVEWIDGDDGTNPQTAAATADRFIASGVQVMIGAAASGISAAVLPKVVAAGRIMISPSATSDSLSQVEDKGLFFRTSPPDKLQGKALADVLMRDGAARVAIVARDDPYGSGLRNEVQNDLNAAGLQAANIRVLSYQAKDTYEPAALTTVFKPLAKSVKEFKPDAVLIVGYNESTVLIKALKDEGVTFKS